jgi:hemerythrin
MSLLTAIDDKESYEVFKLMLLSTIGYLENHFLEEEKYMQEKKYPAYPEHKEQHKLMLREINKMAAKIGHEENITIRSIIEYLKEWYMEHFLGSDKEMGEYFMKSDKNENDDKHEKGISQFH